MTTNAGTTLSIATGKPASEDQSGYEALSFVDCEGVETIPPIGDTQTEVTSTPLKTGRVRHSQGAKTLGVLDVPFVEVSPDAGIDDVRAAAGTNSTYSFKVAYANGDTHYFYGLVSNFQTREATAETDAGGSFQIRPNSGHVRVAG